MVERSQERREAIAQTSILLSLNEDDVLNFYEGDPSIAWCYTQKFKKSFILRTNGLFFIFINIRSEEYSLCPIETVKEHISSYLDYMIIHELIHWSIGEKIEIEEEVWDDYLMKVIKEARS